MQPEPQPVSPDNPSPDAAVADHSDASVHRNDLSETKQKQLDQGEKRTHEASENELPSTQEKNPVPPGSTQP